MNMMKRDVLVLMSGAVFGCVVTFGTAAAADVRRGEALHNTFCIVCHEPTVYTREHRIANSYVEIRQQVQRWQYNAQLRWTAADIDAVTEYLEQKFYTAR